MEGIRFQILIPWHKLWKEVIIQILIPWHKLWKEAIIQRINCGSDFVRVWCVTQHQMTKISNAKFEVDKFNGKNNFELWKLKMCDLLVQQVLLIVFGAGGMLVMKIVCVS